jgi:hypothetical protein
VGSVAFVTMAIKLYSVYNYCRLTHFAHDSS